MRKGLTAIGPAVFTIRVSRTPGAWNAYLAAALRSPHGVGTVTPSSRALAARLAAVVRCSAGPQVVVEVGAGAGEVTEALVERAGRGATVIAIERDPELADRLRARDLGVDVVTADALTLPAVLADRGLSQVDALVSVLPFTLLPHGQQRRFLDVFAGALRPDGVFTAAAYSSGYWTPTARRFRGELHRAFGEVVPTRTTWRNVPPAMTYICRQPVR